MVLPVATILGLAFPTASALLRDELGEAGSESGALLASNTVGAIVGSLVIPFVLMPTIGSPAIIVVLALANATLGVVLAVLARPPRRLLAAAGVAVAVAIGVVAARPGAINQPNVALITSLGGTIFASDEDEIASVQAGQKSSTPELWVAGTSMTLLTVDAKLMPILPLIARPDSDRALVVAFGMGTAFRSALIAGMQTDVVELVPSVPEMFGWYYADADQVLADPDGRLVVADGRNHLELATEAFDVIVTDPPPPIESSGASVISSREYYEAGRDHLTPGGVMMQWVPFGAPEAELKEHIRTFTAVFDEVLLVRGAGGYGFYMLGSDEPIVLDPEVATEVLGRPGVLEDISSAYDSPADTVSRLARRHRSPDLAHRRRCPRLRRRRPPDHRRPPPTRVLPAPSLARDRLTRRARPRPVAPTTTSGSRCYPRADVRPHTRRRARVSRACRGPSPTHDRRRAPAPCRAAPVRRHPPLDVGPARRSQPMGDAVLRVGLPPSVVGRLRPERPRGDPRRLPR